MSSRLLWIGVAVLLTACAHSEDVEWMKVNESYTTAEFRRDVAACTKSGQLDRECMQDRGWVAVKPQATPQKPPDRLRQGPRGY